MLVPRPDDRREGILGRATPRLTGELQPWRPDDARPFDAVAAGHLMNRAGFGATREERDVLASMGLGRAVDALLDFPDAPAQELDPDDLPEEAALADVPRTQADRAEAYARLAEQYPDEDRLRTERQLAGQRWRQGSVRHMAECTRWWVRRMAFGPYPLQEKLTLFWHGHFTSSFRDDSEGSWRLWGQNELLRTHAAGNFGMLLAGVCRDPAMLRYLNNDRNVARSPNENFARELLELFTLGEGNYTEGDIREVARAFTGWSTDGVAFRLRDRQHDGGMKTVFGRRGRLSGAEVVDILLQHPACTPYVASRVFHYFVGRAPSEAEGRRLGEVLRNANFEMRPLLRVVLRSRAFWSTDRFDARIKSPLHLLAGTCRLLGVDPPPPRETNRQLEKLGQVPFQPPNVKGWPAEFDTRRWVNTATLLARFNLGLQLVERMRRVPEPRGQVLDYWLDRLVGRPLRPDRRLAVEEAASGLPGDDVRGLIRLLLSSPEYQLC